MQHTNSNGTFGRTSAGTTAGRSFPAWAVLGVSVCYYLTYFNVGLNLTDEGWFVMAVERILDGQVPYRDFVNYPPLQHYAVALLFTVFGKSLVVLRLFWVAALSVTVMLSYTLSRRLLPIPYRFIPPLIMLVVPGPWHKSFIPLMYLAAANIGWLYISRKGTRSAFIVGLFAGMSVLFRYELPAFLGISFLSLIAASNLKSAGGRGLRSGECLKEALSLTGGALCGFLPWPAVVMSIHGGPEGLSYLLKLLGGHGGAMSLPFPSVIASARVQGIPGVVDAAMFYAPPVTAMGTLVYLAWGWIKGRSSGEERLAALLAVLGLFAYITVLGRTDRAHLLQSIQPCYVLGVYLAWRIASSTTSVTMKAAVAVIPAAAFILFAGTLISQGGVSGGTIGMLSGRQVKVDLPGVGLYAPGADAERLEGTVGEIEALTAPGEPILVVPFTPMLYYITGRVNPTRFDAVLPPTFTDPGMEDDFIETVRDSGVRIVVYADASYSSREEGRFSVYAPKLNRYILDNFAEVARYGQLSVMLRKQSFDG